MIYIGISISIGTLILGVVSYLMLVFTTISGMKETIARLVAKEEMTWAVIAPHLADIIRQPTKES